MSSIQILPKYIRDYSLILHIRVHVEATKAWVKKKKELFISLT